LPQPTDEFVGDDAPFDDTVNDRDGRKAARTEAASREE
jgi:hypothetical protein